jgi:RNA polymerase sigma factor (sigma-70 family)
MQLSKQALSRAPMLYFLISLDADDCTDVELEDQSPSILDLLQQRDTCARVERFLAQLPPSEREILYRLFWFDESQSSIAAALGLNKMTVSRLIAKIFKKAACRLDDLRP